MRSLVTSYVNPDLDGVACAIVVAETEPGGWSPRMSGHLNEETKLVLRALDLEQPDQVMKWNDVIRIWLVDTHHPSQLPQDLPAERVVRIVDHHTGGDPASFPNAEIQNEAVGAAATLVAERAFQRLSPRHAVLLQCAILSNTLDFRAPATSDRDRCVFDALQSLREIDPELRIEMRASRQAVLRLVTKELLRTDVKRFETPLGLIVVSQIETEGALDILDRDDMRPSLNGLATEQNAVAAILNVVDPASARSAILTSQPFLDAALAATLGASAPESRVLSVDRVLQRKTDIVPTLMTLRREER